MAREIAGELDVTAWEALPLAVRLAGHKVMWVEEQLARAYADPETTPAELRDWLAESRRERTLLARTAKATVDAGVLGQLQRNLLMEGQLMGEVLASALDHNESLTEDQRLEILSAAHNRLTAIAGTIGDGTGDADPLGDTG